MNVYPITFRHKDGTTTSAVLVSPVTLPTQFWTLTPAVNGIEYWGYPGGNPPAPTWTALPNLLNQTTALSINILTGYVTPTAGTTLIIVGTPPAGWVFNTGTNLLTYNGTSVSGPATLSFIATNAGISAPSNSFSVSGVGSALADSLAPTVPLGISASGITTTGATLTGLPSSDPSPAGSTWSGMKQYNVTIPGVTGSPFTVNAPSVGTQPAFTLGTIGTGTSTVTQSGADLTVTTTAVDSPYPTSSSVGGGWLQVAGTSWTLSCKVTAFASSNAYDNLRLEARTNLTATGPYVAVITGPIVGGGGVGSEYRAAVGGNATGISSVSCPGVAVWLVIQRSGDTYSFFYSTDGNTLIALGSRTQAMGSTLYIAAGANTNAGGPITSALISQVNINTDPAWTLSLTGLLTASTAYSPSVTSQDVANNVSAAKTYSFTTPVAGTFNPPSPRLWAGRQQGSGGKTFQYAPFISWLRYRCLYCIGIPYTNSVAQFGAGGRGPWVAARKADTLVPGGNKIIQYFDNEAYFGTNPTPPGGSTSAVGSMYSHTDANNWLLRITGTSGALNALPGFGFYVINTSTYPPVDSDGNKPEQFAAKFIYQCFKAGSGPYTAGFSSVDAASQLDGFYHDDVWYCPRVQGSIGRDGTTDNTNVSTNSGSTADNRANAWRAGNALNFATLDSINPNNINVANVDYIGHMLQYNPGFTNDPTIIGLMNQVLDCAESQFTFGWGYWEGIVSFAQTVKALQLQQNMLRPGIKMPLLDIAFLSGVGSTTYGSAGNGIPGSCPLTWSADQPATYSAAYVGVRYYTAFSQIVVDGAIGCDGFDNDLNTNLQTFDEWGDYGSAGMGPGFVGDLRHANSDPIQTAAKYANGIWERRIYNPTTGKYWRWVMNPRGNGAQTYTPGVTLYKARGTQNAAYNSAASFTTLAMASPDGGVFCESPT